MHIGRAHQWKVYLPWKFHPQPNLEDLGAHWEAEPKGHLVNLVPSGRQYYLKYKYSQEKDLHVHVPHGV
jgi:hypothetical protein